VFSKDVLKVLRAEFPDLLGKVKLYERYGNEIMKELLHYEKGQTITQIKLGVMYCKQNQTIEEEMLNNGKWTLIC
jgi:hypothetical protein